MELRISDVPAVSWGGNAALLRPVNAKCNANQTGSSHLLTIKFKQSMVPYIVSRCKFNWELTPSNNQI